MRSASRPTPLDGVRVIDMADGRGEMCGRFLADLGADVIRVEPPGGAASRDAGAAARRRQPALRDPQRGQARRRRRPHDRGGSRAAAAPAGRRRHLDRDDRPGALSELGLGATSSARGTPRLVVLSITDFGQTGPYRDWVATDWTLLAMGGVLSRSGLPGREPLMPPGDLALQVTAMQAAWAALVAYWNRLECGRGDHIDFSLYEATAQVDRPGHGDRGHRAGRGLRGRRAAAPRPARTRSSAVATATCGSSCWRRASGTRCARGWASRRICRIPSSRRFAAGRLRPTGCTRPSSSTSASATSTS